MSASACSTSPHFARCLIAKRPGCGTSVVDLTRTKMKRAEPAVARCSALDTTVFRLRYPRKFEGTYFASQAVCVPAHAEISGNVPDAVSVRMQSAADPPDFAPVFWVVT